MLHATVREALLEDLCDVTADQRGTSSFGAEWVVFVLRADLGTLFVGEHGGVDDTRADEPIDLDGGRINISESVIA